MKVWILGFLAFAACGQAVDQPLPTVEAAPSPDVKAKNEMVSVVRPEVVLEANSAAAAKMPEPTAVPAGREVPDEEARAYGPPSQMWKRELKAGVVAIEHDPVAIEHAAQAEEVSP